MIPINILTSTAVPLPLPNIDTDQIIPKQFLKRIERTGYGDFLFYDWRRIQEAPTTSRARPAFVLNKPDLQGLADPHRREELRLRQLPRARRLGAQPVRLPRRHRPHLRRHLLLQRRQERHHPRPPHRRRSQTLLARCTENPKHQITINLEAQTVTDDHGFNAHFDIDPFRKVLPAERPRRHRPHPPPRSRPRQVRVRTTTKNSGPHPNSLRPHSSCLRPI